MAKNVDQAWRRAACSMSRVLALGSLTCLSACSTTSDSDAPPPELPTPKHAAASQPELQKHWHLVKRSPPTFYPKGLGGDASASFRDGEWVMARNGGGDWFVPFEDVGEVSREQLMDEAVAWKNAVHKIQKQQRRREKSPAGHAGEALAKTAIFTAGAALVIGAAMGGVGASDDSPAMNWLEDMWDAASR